MTEDETVVLGSRIGKRRRSKSLQCSVRYEYCGTWEKVQAWYIEQSHLIPHPLKLLNVT